MSIPKKEHDDIEAGIGELSSMMEEIQSTIEKVTDEVNKGAGAVPNAEEMRKLSKEIDGIHKWSKTGGIQNPEKEMEEANNVVDPPYSVEPTEDTENSDTILDTIFDIVEDEPNNMVLGKKIRNFYHDLITMSEQEEASPDSDEYPYNTEFGSGKTTQEMEAIDEDNRQTELFDSKPNPNQLELF